jgi:hypothetical protein
MDHPGPESLSDDEIMYTKIIHVFTNKKQIYMNNKKKTIHVPKTQANIN